MSYYSDVTIVMRKRDYTKMIRRAEALKDSSVKELIDEAKHYRDRYDKNRRILEWKEVEWYEELYNIGWIYRFIENIDCIFIKIGEDLDDNLYELYGDPYANDFQTSAHINRTISIEDAIELGEEERYSVYCNKET